MITETGAFDFKFDLFFAAISASLQSLLLVQLAHWSFTCMQSSSLPREASAAITPSITSAPIHISANSISLGVGCWVADDTYYVVGIGLSVMVNPAFFRSSQYLG